MKRALALRLFILGLGLTAVPASARAGEPGLPSPASFEEALAAAKKDGKPLVLDFFAVWCGPCKMLARELQKPEAKAWLDGVHLAKVDGEQEPWTALMDRFTVPGFPTLIAFDPEGKEVARQVGFPGYDGAMSWFKDVPNAATPLAAAVAKAKAAPKDGALQLSVARRLVAEGRAGEAKAFYKKAEASSNADVAAAAAWDAGRAELDDSQSSGRRKLAEKVVLKYPASDEAEMALRYLATLPSPPVATIDAAVAKRLDALKANGPALNSLIYVALRGGATKSAEKVALRLQELTPDSPAQLDTVAEAFHMKGDTARAVAIEEKALSLAKGNLAAGLRENLERFRKGNKEIGPDVVAVKAPSMEPEKAGGASSPRSRTSPAAKAQATAQKRIAVECAAVAGGAERVQAYLVTVDKPAEGRVVVRPGTPKALGECVTKVLKSMEVTGGQLVRVDVAMEPPGLKDAVQAAQDKAQTDCAGLAAGLKLATVDAALSGDAGGKPAVVLAMAVPSKELQACVDKSFAALKLPAVTLRTVTFTFGKKVVAEATTAATTLAGPKSAAP